MRKVIHQTESQLAAAAQEPAPASKVALGHSL